MSFTAAFATLGVLTNATDDDVRKAYRQLAKQHHPDHGGDSAKFIAVQEAYEELQTAELRRQYHQHGPRKQRLASHGPGPQRGSSAGSQPAPPPPIAVSVRLTLAELCSGVTRSVTYQREIACQECAGQGGRGEQKVCDRCQGQGLILATRSLGPGLLQRIQQACDVCSHGATHGTGRVWTSPCSSCQSKGLCKESTTRSVVVPPAHCLWQPLVLAMEGHHDLGDVRVQLEVPPSSAGWELQGDRHLVLRRDVSVLDAMLGVVVDEVLPDGSRLCLCTPAIESAVLSPNSVWVVRGLGLPVKVGSSGPGAVIIAFRHVYPSTCSAAQLMQQIQERPPVTMLPSTSHEVWSADAWMAKVTPEMESVRRLVAEEEEARLYPEGRPHDMFSQFFPGMAPGGHGGSGGGGGGQSFSGFQTFGMHPGGHAGGQTFGGGGGQQCRQQ